MPALLLKPLGKLGLALAVLAALAIYREVLVHQRDSARAALAAANLELDQCKAGAGALKSALARQNAAVAALAARADAAGAAARSNEQRAAAAGLAAAAAAQSQVRRLEADKVPDGCVGAIRWGNTQAAAISRW